MNLTAGVGNFSLSSNNAQLTYRRIEVESAQVNAAVNLSYRFIDGYPTFIGADSGLMNTAPTPAHQERDLILVVAANFNNTVIPPAPSGWTTVHTLSTGGSKPAGIRIGYKFAQSNSETVENWFGADRVTVAIYRNVRGLVGVATEDVQSSASSIHYPAADSPVIGTGGTKLIHVGISFDSNDAGSTPTGLTTRTSTQTVSGSSAPSLAIHDQDVDPASTYPAFTNSISTTGKTVGITLGIGFGVPILSATAPSYQTSLNGDVLARTILAPSKGYRAELGEVLTSYQSFFTCNGGSFALNVADPDTHLGFYLQVDSEAYDYSLTEAYLQRGLQLVTQTETFTSTGSAIDLPKGYFTTPTTGVFTFAYSNGDLIHTALLPAERVDLDAAITTTHLQRAIIEAFNGGILGYSLSQVGIRNITASPPGGAAVGKPQFTHAGSDPSNPSFLRPRFVKYNSVSKSRDLGKVNNFFGTFKGDIGSQVGSPTLFFKMEISGKATLRINKNAVNKYTDKQISVGILDANRKQIPLDSSGFAYINDLVATSEDESLEPLPGGTYYFTVSSSQWQKIPYSVSIQAIRFKGIEGVIPLTILPTARFAIAKMEGPALLENGTRAIIPAEDTIKRPNVAILLTNGSRGALVTPEGLTLMRDTSYGRLKETHKISSVIELKSENVATLDAAPPQYGGGYGP